jgi:hypothetical protein
MKRGTLAISIPHIISGGIGARLARYAITTFIEREEK